MQRGIPYMVVEILNMHYLFKKKNRTYVRVLARCKWHLPDGPALVSNFATVSFMKVVQALAGCLSALSSQVFMFPDNDNRAVPGLAQWARQNNKIKTGHACRQPNWEKIYTYNKYRFREINDCGFKDDTRLQWLGKNISCSMSYFFCLLLHNMFQYQQFSYMKHVQRNRNVINGHGWKSRHMANINKKKLIHE